ncbi:site-specific DNA-methyltransferase [Thermophilibacter sp.]
MECVDHATPNILDENVEKLAELFPEVVTEVREPDGSLRHTIDVGALKERVGDVAEGQRERYQFTWPGKRDAKQEAYRPIDKCLRPCPEESVDWGTTQNLYIEGDNLDALKLLRNTYAGKVKMIYIDPPYNTGNDSFIYDDVFRENEAEYRVGNAAFDDEGNVLDSSFKQNNESNGRFHSNWCSMMYPRLLLARDLLSEDGLLFISLDTVEIANLQRMLQDIFGPTCVLGLFPRVTKRAGKSSDIASNNDYVVLVGKTNSAVLKLPLHTDPGFSNKDEYFTERGAYKLNQTLDYDSLQYNKTMDYPFEIDGEVFVPGGSMDLYRQRHSGRHGRTDWVWRWSKDLLQFGLENGFVVVKEGRDRKRIYTKTYQDASIERTARGYKVVI